MTKKNYVNNKDFLEALVEYKKRCTEAEDSGEELPRVPNYIGECIYQIANRLSSKPNFSGYSYRDDMVMDGIENCLLYIRNFDETKSSNPFAYFTQIIWYAFLRRIQKEKKQMYIRFKSSHSMLSQGQTYESDEVHLHLNTNVDYINSFIEDFEGKLSRDKEKKNAAGDHRGSDTKTN
jgi:DNA-directed RNA polymerase specialized sigma24 family protein